MNRKKKVLILAIMLIGFVFWNNIAIASEKTEPQTKFPDYSYEYVGFDKCERFNRKIFKFNMKANDYILRPINRVWASIMPKYGTEKIQNAYTNMEYPIRLFSCLLQKDFKAAKSETARFFINTTIGFGGTYDNAKKIFKIDPTQEDMGQVLAHYHLKKGPYVVIPIVAFGNTRDIVGKILDCPFNPSCYVVGPIAILAKTVLLVNRTTCAQPLLKSINSSFADPYEITKKLYGVDRFIKCENLDRKEVLSKKTENDNLVNINQIMPTVNLQTDIKLKNYNSQGALTDALRTALYSDSSINKSIWGELSVWNKSFSNSIKTSYVKITDNKPIYKFRYILQKNKNAPLAIIYPSIGEGITSQHSVVMAKMLYDEGYSVLIQGSAFQWEFAQSMPDNFAPGIPDNDAKYLRLTTKKILSKLETKYGIKPERKILIGTSFGALTGLFTAAQEDKENTLDISKFICISPPVDIFFALKQIDKYSLDWKNSPKDIKIRAAITSQKVLNKIKETNDETDGERKSENCGEKNVNFNFSEDETKLIMGVIMKQKLSDLVFTLENGNKKLPDDSKTKFKDIYTKINNMSFYDYATNYLAIKNIPQDELEYKTSLYTIADFLKNSNKIKIYESVNDYYTKPEQLQWLKNQTGDKSVFLNDGSHLGYLYRKEFKDCLIKDISLSSKKPELEHNQIEPGKDKIHFIKNELLN